MAYERGNWRDSTSHWKSINERRDERQQRDRDRRAERMAEYMSDEANN